MAHTPSIPQGYVRELVAAALIIGFAIVWRSWTGGPSANARPPVPPGPVAGQAVGAKPVALVNGAEITADELAA